MEKKSSKKKTATPPIVDTIECGEVQIAILLKRTPTGYRYHEYEPVRCWKTPSGKTMTSRTYTAHDTVDFLHAIAAASARCQELDSQLIKRVLPAEAA